MERELTLGDIERMGLPIPPAWEQVLRELADVLREMMEATGKEGE